MEMRRGKAQRRGRGSAQQTRFHSADRPAGGAHVTRVHCNAPHTVAAEGEGSMRPRYGLSQQCPTRYVFRKQLLNERWSIKSKAQKPLPESGTSSIARDNQLEDTASLLADKEWKSKINVGDEFVGLHIGERTTCAVRRVCEHRSQGDSPCIKKLDEPTAILLMPDIPTRSSANDVDMQSVHCGASAIQKWKNMSPSQKEGCFYFRGSVSNWMLSEPLSVVKDSHGLERTAIFLFKLLVKWALGEAGLDHALRFAITVPPYSSKGWHDVIRRAVSCVIPRNALVVFCPEDVAACLGSSQPAPRLTVLVNQDQDQFDCVYVECARGRAMRVEGAPKRMSRWDLARCTESIVILYTGNHSEGETGAESTAWRCSGYELAKGAASFGVDGGVDQATVAHSYCLKETSSERESESEYHRVVNSGQTVRLGDCFAAEKYIQFDMRHRIVVCMRSDDGDFHKQLCSFAVDVKQAEVIQWQFLFEKKLIVEMRVAPHGADWKDEHITKSDRKEVEWDWRECGDDCWCRRRGREWS